MRARNLTAALAALVILPFGTPAQGGTRVSLAEGDEATSEGGGETEGVEVVEDPAEVSGKVPDGAKVTAPGEVHTVGKGDTLWDLSQRYLGSPWYWPKVWSYNPEIANPHWIYPGNRVRFFPSGEEVPTQVEVGAGPDSLKELDEVEPETADSSAVTVAGKIGYTPKNYTRMAHVGFATSKELDEAGRIDSSFSEHELFSFPDTVYISFERKGEVRIGERYVIFKTASEVVHPVSGERYGYLTHFLGTVKLISVSDKLVTGVIESTYDEIRRGALVGPFGEQLWKNVAVKANDRDLKGYLIGTMEPDVTMLGEHHLVVVDKGSSDGVQQGNTFAIVRQLDGQRADFYHLPEADERLPVEDIASCMAVDVKDKATTCLLTRSMRELAVGDRVVMRKAGSPARASLP